jgi:cellulose synthase/poly-beta-1,6-N-acetylglucosamine synthase-like glycosyltransferase
MTLAIDWHHLLLRAVVNFNEFVIYYFLTLNSVYLILFIVSLFEVIRFVRRTFFSDYQQILKSEMTWPISILVPAFNEERGIVDTLRSLLQLNYGEFEIVVVNDGSTDSTLEQLIKAFDLRQTDRIYRRTLPTAKVRGIYASLEVPSLTVVDKEKGGKSDALNTGINISRYPLFCSVDADSVIEENALLRVVKPFMEQPEEMVAVGGIVRIINGCEVRDGRVTRIGLPRRALPVFQVVEYLRAFLSGRIGWSVMRSLLIISGAFGLYKKADVVAVGGYDSFTDTEDLELVVKLHEHLKRQKTRYRIVFVPDPVCWTEAPEKFKTLLLQRNRWHRGLLQSFRRHWRMLFNPRYGVIGTLALPYFLFFEMLGPFVEVLGYLSVIAAYFLGILNREFFLLFLLVAIFYGVFLSIAAVLLEEISFRRYPGWEDLARLIWYSIWENIGYRQLLALFKVKAFFDFLGRRRRWGEMGHKGFGDERPAAPPPSRPQAA